MIFQYFEPAAKCPRFTTTVVVFSLCPRVLENFLNLSICPRFQHYAGKKINNVQIHWKYKRNGILRIKVCVFVKYIPWITQVGFFFWMNDWIFFSVGWILRLCWKLTETWEGCIYDILININVRVMLALFSVCRELMNGWKTMSAGWSA